MDTIYRLGNGFVALLLVLTVAAGLWNMFETVNEDLALTILAPGLLIVGTVGAVMGVFFVMERNR